MLGGVAEAVLGPQWGWILAISGIVIIVAHELGDNGQFDQTREGRVARGLGVMAQKAGQGVVLVLKCIDWLLAILGQKARSGARRIGRFIEENVQLNININLNITLPRIVAGLGLLGGGGWLALQFGLPV